MSGEASGKYRSYTQQRPLFEQFKASVLIINKHSGNQPPIAIDRVRPEFDIFTKQQLAHGLFRSLTERLAFLWRIDKSDTDPDLFFAEDAHVDRVAVDNACYASVDRHVLQAKSVRDRRGRILANNAKSAGENNQGDESSKHGRFASSL